MVQSRRSFGLRLGFVLLFGVGMVVGLAALAYWGGALNPSVADYHIDAVMPTVSSLQPGARVTMAGAQVGQVGSITRRGNGAIVQLDITDRSVTPVPADTRVQLSVVTPIGENYVQMLPGTSAQKLRSGSVLPMSATDDYVDVDQLMSVLQGSTTQRTRQLIEGLGAALAGHGQQLNDTLAGTSNTVTPLANVFQILDTDRASVDQLTAELGDIASAAGRRGRDIIELAGDGLQTFRAIAAQDDNLRATLDQLPSTLGQVHTTADELNSVTNTAAPVLTNLAVALRGLEPAITSLKPAADEGHVVLSELAATAPGLETTLGRVRSVAKPATGALPRIRSVLCQVNPMLRYIDPNPSSSAPSYVNDLIAFITNFGSAVNGYDNISHLVRLVPILGDNSISGLPSSVSTATYDLLHAGILGNSTALTWDPYPKPGLIGSEHATGDPAVIGPSQLKAKTGYVYPHITASC
jgi:phospholipid/cholesterol/gamma-HCH transport system substrate-binding protein